MSIIIMDGNERKGRPKKERKKVIEKNEREI